jgi:formiminoglutamase
MKTIPQSVLDLIKKQMIVYVTIHMTASVFERIFNQEMLSALEFIKTDFLIEIDLDASQYCEQRHDFKWFLSRRAQTVYFFLVNKNVSYIHICEGAPDLGEEKNTHLIGRIGTWY